jgi:hypothetical protein
MWRGREHTENHILEIINWQTDTATINYNKKTAKV